MYVPCPLFLLYWEDWQAIYETPTGSRDTPLGVIWHPPNATGSGRVGVRVPQTRAVGGLGGQATVLTGRLLLSGPEWAFEWPSFRGRGASILRLSCCVTLLLRENSVFSFVASPQETCVLLRVVAFILLIEVIV